MTETSSIAFTVYPDDCDAFGHLNQASLLTLFERARWDAIARGPGIDLFTRNHVQPVVRKTTVEYYEQVFPGDRLHFSIELGQQGQTSFTLRQSARKERGSRPVAEAELVFVCVDRDGKPQAVPDEVSTLFGGRPSRRTGVTQHLSVNGLATAVDASGDGVAVLLLHGFPLDRTVWRQMSGKLTGWRRIAPDLRGFGLTEAPESGYSIGAYTDDLVALLDTLHIERAVVCGLSMGGYVAFDMVRRYSDRVRALILMNTRATPDNAEGRARRDATLARVRRDGPTFLAAEMLPKLLAPATRQTMPDVVEHVRNMITNQVSDGVAGALAAMRDRPDSTLTLSEIDVPTLVMAGRDDQIVPVAEARTMAEGIPHAQFSVIPDAGHLTPMEQPVNVTRVVKEFLESLD